MVPEALHTWMASHARLLVAGSSYQRLSRGNDFNGFWTCRSHLCRFSPSPRPAATGAAKCCGNQSSYWQLSVLSWRPSISSSSRCWNFLTGRHQVAALYRSNFDLKRFLCDCGTPLSLTVRLGALAMSESCHLIPTARFRATTDAALDYLRCRSITQQPVVSQCENFTSLGYIKGDGYRHIQRAPRRSQ